MYSFCVQRLDPHSWNSFLVHRFVLLVLLLNTSFFILGEHSPECQLIGLNRLSCRFKSSVKLARRLSIESFPLATMSLSKASNSPLSAEEARTLTSLLMRMQAAGLEPTADPQGYGAMTDASKRRKSESEIDLEEEFEHIDPFVKFEMAQLETGKPQSSSEVPVVKTLVKLPLVNVGGVKIPPSQKDMEDWSTTVRELPKVVALGMSYAELVVADPEHMEYLIWVRAHGVKKGGRFEDFSLFLQAIDYSRERVCPSSHNTYPGTNQVRKKKVPVESKKSSAA